MYPQPPPKKKGMGALRITILILFVICCVLPALWYQLAPCTIIVCR